ncbi:MAG: EI24 domain-containing protein [Paracoccaceae bacterium]
MIFNDFAKAVGQLTDPRFAKVLFFGLGLTVALLFVIYVVFAWFIGWIIPDVITLPWIGEITWVDNIASGASVLVMLVLSMFLMVPVASAFTGFFLDNVAAAVEEKHYPHLPKVKPIPFSETLRDSAAFLGLIVVANIAALLVYALTTIAAPLIFWTLNGFLLGREYFQLVAMRRLGREGAKIARARHGTTILMAGILMAVPLSIPLVNLLVPILGAATFTHLFHRLYPAENAPARTAPQAAIPR